MRAPNGGYGNPQAHHAVGVDAGEDPAALLVDDNDLADRDFSQWGAVGPEFDCPQPVESYGALACRTQSGQIGL